MFSFTILGSGSKGNSTLVRQGGAGILIDIGFSCRELCRRLHSVGMNPEQLTGVVLSHEHSDHVRGLEVFLKSYPVPVFCNLMTREAMRGKCFDSVDWRIFETGQEFPVGDFGLETFPVPHDAAEPCGFVVNGSSGARFGCLTDLGFVTSAMMQRMKKLDSLFVEANYDPTMLANDPKRPWSLKQRISSRHGHLSNEQTAEMVMQLAADGSLREVVLGHISQDCNTSELAVDVVSNLAKDFTVVAAAQEVPTREFPIRCRPQLDTVPKKSKQMAAFEQLELF